MTIRDFRSKYAGSLMGVFWTVINPLLLLAVFSFVGIAVVKVKFGDHPGTNALYIFCGILPWLAFQDGVARSTSIIVENRNLVTRARFPASVLPVHPVLSSFFSQLVGTAVLVALAIFVTRSVGPPLLLLPLLFALQLLLTFGICLVVGPVSVYVRDVAHVMPVILLVWMFGTPIFYQVEMVPEVFRALVLANPVAGLIECYRAAILDGSWPAPVHLAVPAAWTAVFLVLGDLSFRKLRQGLADRL